jgi:hypothetical protein
MARAYLVTQVAGQASGTRQSKGRALRAFLDFYRALYHHDDPAEWYKSVTEEFLKQLRDGKVIAGREGGRPSMDTVRRVYAHVRHFARWVHGVSRSPLDARPIRFASRRSATLPGKACLSETKSGFVLQPRPFASRQAAVGPTASAMKPSLRRF